MDKKLVLGTFLLGSTAIVKAQNPNIVFILADDMGYGDVTALNKDCKIPTPNIDRLMEEGVQFTDAHTSSSVSTPSRYGILTGRYNWRSRLKSFVLNFYDEPLIDPTRTTMASMLRNQGYQTACIGKWHLGMKFATTDGKRPVDEKDAFNLDFSKEFKGGPVDVGFDYFFGVDCPNYPPYCFLENRKTIGIPTVYRPTNYKLDSRGGHALKDWDQMDVLPAVTQRAADYVDQAAKKNQPFFLYIPLTSPHTPILPTKEFEGKSGLNLYTDFVMQTDASIGKVLEALKRNGIEENTLVVFATDNGCSPIVDFKFLTERGHDPSYIFRGMKSDLYEGGHHVPCVVRWPAKAKPHKIKQTICMTDFMATFAAITGYKLSDNEAEDSYNILSLITAKKKEPAVIREATVHHSIDGRFAIRQGKWKLLLCNYSGGWSLPHPKGAYKEPFQLFDLEKDPEETTNLSKDYPEKVEELRKLMVHYIKEGRSTPGIPQKNDPVKKWHQIETEWMK